MTHFLRFTCRLCGFWRLVAWLLFPAFRGSHYGASMLFLRLLGELANPVAAVRGRLARTEHVEA